MPIAAIISLETPMTAPMGVKTAADIDALLLAHAHNVGT